MSELDTPEQLNNTTIEQVSTPVPAATTVDPASAPTEAPNGEAPAEPAATPEAPAWFVKETAKLRRQRAESERRADRLASEIEALKRPPSQPAQPKSTELRPSDFPNYDAFIEAKISAGVKEGIGAVEQSRSQTEAQKAANSHADAFTEKATEQAEAAGIDFDAVMDTLARPHVPFTGMVMRLVTESDNTARLAEFLAENPVELDRVSRLGPALAKKALDKMEAGLAAPPKSSATNAPPPPPKVGGRSVNQTDWRKSENMDDYASNWQREREAKG